MAILHAAMSDKSCCSVEEHMVEQQLYNFYIDKPTKFKVNEDSLKEIYNHKNLYIILDTLDIKYFIKEIKRDTIFYKTNHGFLEIDKITNDISVKTGAFKKLDFEDEIKAKLKDLKEKAEILIEYTNGYYL